MWKLILEKTFTKKRIFWLILFACFGVELTILSHELLRDHQITSSIVLFSASVIFSIITILFHRIKTDTTAWNYLSNNVSYLTCIAIVLLFGHTFYELITSVIKTTPIDVNYSDIIPTIQQQVDRFIHGQKVYQTIQFDKYSYPSGYLPANWFPFCLAALLQIDFRYIPFLVFYISLFIGIIFYRDKINNGLSLLLFMLIPFSLIWFLLHNKLIVAYSVELIVASYYLLFILFINKKNNILLGLCIALCLLSRYTLLLYLPLYFFILFIDKEFKAIKQIAFSSILFLSLFYILPFFIADPLVIIKGFLSYSDSGIGEWNHLNEYTGLPEHLTQGAGFAYLFYLIKGVSIAEKIKYMQLFLVFILLAFMFLMGYIYYKKHTQFKTATFLLGSFKLYLCIFFSFIHVPYIYLYTTSILVTAGILFYLSTMEKPVNQELE